MTPNTSTKNLPIAKQDSLQAGQSASLSSQGKDTNQLRNAPSEGKDVKCQSIKVPTPLGGLETSCLPLWANLSILGLLVLTLPLACWLSLSRKREQNSDASRQPKWVLIILSLTTLLIAAWAGQQVITLFSTKAKSPSETPNFSSTSPAIKDNVPIPNSTPTPPSALFSRPSEKEARIDLSWRDAKPDEDGYRIQRQSLEKAGDDYEEIAVLPASQNSFSDRSIVPGLGYTYRITSFNSFGSSFSPVARARGNRLIGPSQAIARVDPEKVRALLNEIDYYDRKELSANMPERQEVRFLFLVIEIALTMSLTSLALLLVVSTFPENYLSFFVLKWKLQCRAYIILLLGLGAVTAQVASHYQASLMITESRRAGATAEVKSELSILRSKATDVSSKTDLAMIRESFYNLLRKNGNTGF
ncbi:fibronectin type III domain-containing protein [Cyanobium sp. NIES-981]|uniref:fibronectin type III domain-containing protein n=1 Tax=Cyanobium sp. NIES-981 TaxID=1851505 RepID=UPI0012FC3300|nr:fibronectin type III domain-containing protein [Cyanobium sp. NIES-981]